MRNGQHRQLSRKLLRVVLLVALFCPFSAIVDPVTAGAATVDSRSAPDSTCSETDIPVAIRANTPASYHVHAQICRPHDAYRAALLLVAGATYTHWYWDPTYQPNKYSFVQAANARGYATVNIDRLGVGQSSRPPSTDVTIPTGAYVAHQVIAKMRDGSLLGSVPAEVATVGHSIGTLMVWQEAADYHDVDGVLGESFTREPALAGSASAIGSFAPAQLDPRIGPQSPPLGYITTIPGTRGSAFYNTASADPGMIQADEDNKSTATAGELSTLETSIAASLMQTPKINVPVLTVIGSKDSSYCGPAGDCNSATSLKSTEASHFSPAACFQFTTVPDAGHVVNLHRNGPAQFSADFDWLDSRVVGAGCPNG